VNAEVLAATGNPDVKFIREPAGLVTAQ